MLRYGLSCVKTNVNMCTCFCTLGYEGHNPWNTRYLNTMAEAAPITPKKGE